MYICTMRSIMVLVELFLNATAYRYILRHVTGHVYIYIWLRLNMPLQCVQIWLVGTVFVRDYMYIHIYTYTCVKLQLLRVSLYMCQVLMTPRRCTRSSVPKQVHPLLALLLCSFAVGLVASHASNIYRYSFMHGMFACNYI